jgi:hypothetical protein
MQKTGELVTGLEVYDISGIVRGEEVKKPRLSKYTVFVQSKGSGARHLSANSRLLYEVIMPYSQFLVLLYENEGLSLLRIILLYIVQAPSSIGLGTPKEPLLMPVLKGRVQLNQLAESLKLQEFCKKHNLNLKSDSVFLEIQVLKRCNKTICDVILLDVGYLQ